ncbi:MAG: porin family protein [Ekhidna sp.]
MKKTLLTIGLSLIIMTGFSQAKVEIGIKGGANISNIDSNNPTATIESASSFHAGIYGLIKLANIGIQPEILYSPQKNDVVDPTLGTISQERVYLDIPIMVKVYVPGGVNIQAGPQFSVLTSAESAGIDVEDQLKGGDVSLAAGLGWDAPFGLQLNARYILGLSDISDNAAVELKNRTLQFSVGYKLFKLGR